MKFCEIITLKTLQLHKANSKCIYSPVSFAPKQWSDYQFGAQAARFWGGQEANSFAMKPQDIDNLILDENGKVAVEIASAIPANAPRPIQALTADGEWSVSSILADAFPKMEEKFTPIGRA